MSSQLFFQGKHLFYNYGINLPSTTVIQEIEVQLDAKIGNASNGSSDIVCNAHMRVGEIRQFCKLQDEGQSLMRRR